MLTKDQILAAQDRATESVDVPEWGGDVLVGVMGGNEWKRYTDWLANIGRPEGIGGYELLASLCLVDENGNRLFSDKEVSDLGRKSWFALERVFDAAARLNKLRKQDREELEKNSETGPAAGSSSDSPAT